MSLTSGCPVCTQAEDRTLRLFHTAYWVGVLLPDQQFLGQSMLIPVDHRESFANLSRLTKSDFAEAASRMEATIQRSYKPEYIDIETVYGQEMVGPRPKPHFALRYMPRYREPVRENGEVFGDAYFGHHHRHDRRVVTPATLGRIMEHMKSRS